MLPGYSQHISDGFLLPKGTLLESLIHHLPALTEVLIKWIKFLKIYFKRINDAGILDLRISSI